MRTRSQSMDNTETGSDGSADTGSIDASSDDDNEFVFDGFKLMFAEKVMLTPVVPAAAPAALTQAQSRRWH